MTRSGAMSSARWSEKWMAEISGEKHWRSVGEEKEGKRKQKETKEKEERRKENNSKIGLAHNF